MTARRLAQPMSPSLFSWQRKLFWKYTLSLLLTSFISTIGLTAVFSWIYQRDVRHSIESPAFERSLANAFDEYRILTQRETPQVTDCGRLMRSLTRNLYEQQGIRGDPRNDFQDSIEQGRLVLTFSGGQSSCSFPGNANAELLQGMRDFEARQAGRAGGETLSPNRFGGWTRIQSIVPAAEPGAVMTVGIAGLSVSEILAGALTRGWTWLVPYIVGSCCINALILVGFLLRRIRRAEATAAQWADGNLGARINDHGKDEFRQLADNFDTMADALNNVIRVKQNLAALEERNRLARDLHDTAKQRCFALGLQLSILRKQHRDDPASLRLTEAALALTDHLQNDLRNIITRLSAPTVSELGLSAALQESLAVLLSGNDIALSVEVGADDDEALKARPELGVELMVIALEAASNAARHSGATQVTVALRRHAGRYEWVIVDDGNGFDVAAGTGDGMGLTNMRHRAEALPNGQFLLQSVAGAGTTIRVFFDNPIIQGAT
jgi:signal transduction histidine kinase